MYLDSSAVSPAGSIQVFPENEIFDYGDNVTLSCIAEGGPGNVFWWIDINGAISPGHLLTLTSIITSQGGEYTCVASNGAGSGSETTTVLVSPRITRAPLDRQTTNGSFFLLVCEGEAFPDPQYTWSHSGGTALRNVVTTTGGSRLIFDPVLFGDEGTYYCEVTSNNITVQSEGATITGKFETAIMIWPCLFS